MTRLITRYGKLPDDSELAVLRKTDAAAFPPTVLFRYQRELEPPEASEGFSRIDVVRFEQRRDPAHVNRAVILWCDEAAELEPLPRLGVQVIHRHQLNPQRCLYVGTGSQDAGFARKLGFTHSASLAF